MLWCVNHSQFIYLFGFYLFGTIKILIRQMIESANRENKINTDTNQTFRGRCVFESMRYIVIFAVQKFCSRRCVVVVASLFFFLFGFQCDLNDYF